MPAQDPEKGDNGGVQSPGRASTHYSGRKSLSHRYNNTPGYDAESQTAAPQGAPFPGATYGFNPGDQPEQPPRRVSSVTSLRKARSQASLHGDGHTDADADGMQNPDELPEESLAEELAWNASHPCYPHPNPHVPLTAPAYNLTRIIRVKRDWMAHGDLAPAYSNIYPEILDPLLPEPEFRFLVNHVNRTLLEAFDPFRAWNWVDGFLGLVTGWLWEDFRPSGMKGKLRGLEFWIEQWNQRVGSRDGVRVIPLRRTGYMSLDIEIPDPQVRVVDPDADLDGDETGDLEGAPGDIDRQQQIRVGELRRSMAPTETEDGSRV